MSQVRLTCHRHGPIMSRIRKPLTLYSTCANWSFRKYLLCAKIYLKARNKRIIKNSKILGTCRWDVWVNMPMSGWLSLRIKAAKMSLSKTSSQTSFSTSGIGKVTDSSNFSRPTRSTWFYFRMSAFSERRWDWRISFIWILDWGQSLIARKQPWAYLTNIIKDFIISPLVHTNAVCRTRNKW